MHPRRYHSAENVELGMLVINISTLEAKSGNVEDQHHCGHLAANRDEHHAKASVCTVMVVLFDS
jgi:hypothetical protein